jgi:hypothetical protein
LIKAPMSVLRLVTTPSNGANTRLKDSSGLRRVASAQMAATTGMLLLAKMSSGLREVSRLFQGGRAPPFHPKRCRRDATGRRRITIETGGERPAIGPTNPCGTFDSALERHAPSSGLKGFFGPEECRTL